MNGGSGFDGVFGVVAEERSAGRHTCNDMYTFVRGQDRWRLVGGEI